LDETWVRIASSVRASITRIIDEASDIGSDAQLPAYEVPINIRGVEARTLEAMRTQVASN
jgi:hypothetical protein